MIHGRPGAFAGPRGILPWHPHSAYGTISCDGDCWDVRDQVRKTGDEIPFNGRDSSATRAGGEIVGRIRMAVIRHHVFLGKVSAAGPRAPIKIRQRHPLTTPKCPQGASRSQFFALRTPMVLCGMNTVHEIGLCGWSQVGAGENQGRGLAMP